MDLHLASPPPGPFAYLVGEHARAVVAIQELQREVNSLLAFRDHVLEALPHLQLREQPAGVATPRPRPSSQQQHQHQQQQQQQQPTSGGGKSLSEGPPTVVADSGFSTDKASTSMGKSSSSSSSSSSSELSGGGRWPLLVVDNPEGVGPLPQHALGSAEDELWTLLEVIEKKGTRLRKDLEKAEEREREQLLGGVGGHASDPTTTSSSPLPPPLNERWRDWWPHSLPGAGPPPRVDFVVPGFEAWGEVERLRVDRVYLMSRLQRAEAEGGAAHQRLLDLHGQLLALAGEKRRLEDAFRALKIGSSADSPKASGKGVTVSVGGGGDPSIPSANKRPSSSVLRVGEDVLLPRVLKVPIKDKWTSKPPSRIPQGVPAAPVAASRNESSSASTNKTIVLFSSPSSKGSSSTPSSTGSTAGIGSSGDRVVIERERNANRVDGGLSMPASLLKGARIKVRPDKQRISAILKEKDVLALQRQLLTTVMETEVLRRQLEMAGEEWESRLKEWESERGKREEAHISLKEENTSLKKQLDRMRNVRRVDIGVGAKPSTLSIGVGTSTDNDEIDGTPSFSVHPGPNVKYDVVIYDETSSSSSERALSVSKQQKVPPAVIPRKSQSSTASIEKPPRRARPLSVGPTAGSDSQSYGRDSLGRVARIPLKPSARTPPATPRSSPAPSISALRNAGPGRRSPLQDGGQLPQQQQQQGSRGGGNGRSSSTTTASSTLGRRDSMKVAMMGSVGSGSSSTIVSKGATSGGPVHNKSTPWLHRNANGTIKLSRDKVRRTNNRNNVDSVVNAGRYGMRKPSEDEDTPSDSNDFFDSISDSLSSHSGYAKVNSPNVQYLPQPPRLWTPLYSHTLPFQKGGYVKSVDNLGFTPHWERYREEIISPPSDSLEVDRDSTFLTQQEELGKEKSPRPLDEVYYRGLLKNRRVPGGGVLRMKKQQDRPSVLSMTPSTYNKHSRIEDS